MTQGLLSKCTISKGIWNCLFKHDVFSLFAFFLVQGITIILRSGRRAESNEKAFRFQKQNVFSKKTILEQG